MLCKPFSAMGIGHITRRPALGAKPLGGALENLIKESIVQTRELMSVVSLKVSACHAINSAGKRTTQDHRLIMLVANN
jgi:hypothetical protein